jgi:hypothetical protein
MVLINTGSGKGRVYNISQDETLALEEFLAMLVGLAGYELCLVSVNTPWLDYCHLLLDCSPFTDSWMSALDDRRSKEELGCSTHPWRSTVNATHSTTPTQAPRSCGTRPWWFTSND